MLTKGCHRTLASMLRYVGCSRSDNSRDEISRSENVRCRGEKKRDEDGTHTGWRTRKEAGPGASTSTWTRWWFWSDRDFVSTRRNFDNQQQQQQRSLVALQPTKLTPLSNLYLLGTRTLLPSLEGWLVGAIRRGAGPEKTRDIPLTRTRREKQHRNLTRPLYFSPLAPSPQIYEVYGSTALSAHLFPSS